jgi:ADP-ribosyl-[dinitrogen reductase] hydrolase
VAGAPRRRARCNRAEIATRFGYDLGQSVDQIRTWYAFDISCRGTVPPAIVCALEANGYEDAVRNAVSLGGDSDTLACITGGIAEAVHGLPTDIAEQARAYLDDELRRVIERFYARVSARV